MSNSKDLDHRHPSNSLSASMDNWNGRNTKTSVLAPVRCVFDILNT